MHRRVRVHFERTQRVAQDQCGVDDVAEPGARRRIEVEQHVVWAVGSVAARGPHVQVDGAVFDHPEERGLVVDERVAHELAAA